MASSSTQNRFRLSLLAALISTATAPALAATTDSTASKKSATPKKP